MFTVPWRKSARDQLAALWVEADSPLRQAITDAAYWIDEELQEDPESQGEARHGSERICFVIPLAVWFKVDKQNSVFTCYASPPMDGDHSNDSE